MNRLGDRTADIFVPPDTFWTDQPRCITRRQIDDDQLPRPGLLHLVVGVAMVLIATLIAATSFCALTGASRENDYWGLFLMVALCSAPIAWLQFYGLLRRSYLASFICAVFQLPLAAWLANAVFGSLVRAFSRGMERQDIDVPALSITILLVAATGLNFAWGSKLLKAEISPRWIRRFSLAELAAWTAGASLVAAIIAAFINR